MAILPEPKDSNTDFLKLHKMLMGENGLAFLNLDNAIATIKQGQPVWQAPFAIGLHALPFFLYRWGTDRPFAEVPDVAFLVIEWASQAHLESGDAVTFSDLAGSALEPLEARYASLSVEIPGYGLGDEQAHTLFHTCFALGVLLLLKGDEERATTILRQMIATKTERRGPTTSIGMGLSHVDVGVTKALAAVVLQDFYAKRQDYEFALYLLTEAVASSGTGYFSEGLLAVVPRLIESFAEKCERDNDLTDYLEVRTSNGSLEKGKIPSGLSEWIDLFDRAANITEICGEADVSGELPSDCKVTSPQFLAWKFGQLVARFAIRNSSSLGHSRKIVPDGYQDHGTSENSIFGLEGGGYEGDWLNGTVVASLLLEYDERRDWQILRQQYISMWEALPRHQWLSLCEAGTQTDLYWAVRIGFVDKMLETTEQGALIPAQPEPSPIVRDIEMTRDIASTIALRQLKEQFDLGRVLELQQNMLERLPTGKREVRHELQQRLNLVWSKLPARVVDTLVKAENYYGTGVNTDDAKVWFNKAVEASLSCCLVEPLVSFMEKRGNKRIAICFPPPRGVERKTSYELRKLSLLEWSDVCDTLSVPADKSLASLGAEDLKQFMKEHFGELRPPALRELSRSLRDFCLRKDSAHYHIPRHQEEVQELEQMRELALGIKRPSVITQIFQLFN